MTSTVHSRMVIAMKLRLTEPTLDFFWGSSFSGDMLFSDADGLTVVDSCFMFSEGKEVYFRRSYDNLYFLNFKSFGDFLEISPADSRFRAQGWWLYDTRGYKKGCLERHPFFIGRIIWQPQCFLKRNTYRWITDVFVQKNKNVLMKDLEVWAELLNDHHNKTLLEFLRIWITP